MSSDSQKENVVINYVHQNNFTAAYKAAKKVTSKTRRARIVRYINRMIDHGCQN